MIALSPLLTPTVPPPVWKRVLAHGMSRVWPGFHLSSGVRPNDLSHDSEVTGQYRRDPLVHDRVSAILGTTLLEAGRWACNTPGSGRCLCC